MTNLVSLSLSLCTVWPSVLSPCKSVSLFLPALLHYPASAILTHGAGCGKEKRRQKERQRETEIERKQIHKWTFVLLINKKWWEDGEEGMKMVIGQKELTVVRSHRTRFSIPLRCFYIWTRSSLMCLTVALPRFAASRSWHSKNAALKLKVHFLTSRFFLIIKRVTWRNKISIIICDDSFIHYDLEYKVNSFGPILVNVFYST